MKLMTELSQFVGTTQYYKFSALTKMVLTDGTKYLAEEAGCYWLFDIVASYQCEKKVKGEEFQVWNLKVNKDNSAVVTCEDGNDNEIVKQLIPYTDFPLKEMKLFFQNNVCFLPSEY